MVPKMDDEGGDENREPIKPTKEQSKYSVLAFKGENYIQKGMNNFLGTAGKGMTGTFDYISFMNISAK